MDQIYPDDGLIEILTNVVAPGLLYHLFVNDIDPALSDTLVSFVEAAWSGYAPISVPGASFSFQNVAAHVGQVTAANINFANTSGNPQRVFGFFATDLAGVHVITCARFDGAPITIPNGGMQTVQPAIANFSGLQS